LLSDFGSADEYVGVMKGDVLRRCGDAVIVDISHEIDPGDVTRAALALANAVQHFPDGTIHVAVVDPGVGSERRALLVDCGNCLLVGPDNGLLSLAMPSGAQAYALDRAEFFVSEVSATFHGRDVFAPVAGHLAAGRVAREMGSPVAEIQLLRLPMPRSIEGAIIGEFLYADHFGNLVTNIDRVNIESLDDDACVVVGDVAIGSIQSTYTDAQEDALVALIGSTDRLEISVVGGSAAARLGPRGARGASVRIGRREE
jgi:S-adenosylmethionine hydrolase